MPRTLLLLLASACACGPSLGTDEEPTCDPWAEVCTVTMRPDFDHGVVLELPTARTEDTESFDDMRGDEVGAGTSRYLSLGGFQGGGQQCLLPDVHDDLSEVETDAPDACWGTIVYFGLTGEPPDGFVGRGILLQTSDGDLYRARVLHDDSRPESSELTFEYEGVP